jgi:hypothetical protein
MNLRRSGVLVDQQIIVIATQNHPTDQVISGCNAQQLNPRGLQHIGVFNGIKNPDAINLYVHIRFQGSQVGQAIQHRGTS